MNIMELGAIGELVGGVAVIASLVYVGFQIRQSTLATRGQAVTTRFSGNIAGEIAMMGHDGAAAVAKAFDQPSGLSTGEIFQVWAYLSANILAIQNSFETYVMGLSSHQDWISASGAGRRLTHLP